MAGPSGSAAGADNAAAAATAAALRGASLAFSHGQQKKTTEATSNANQQGTYLSPPGGSVRGPMRRTPSVSPSRSGGNGSIHSGSSSNTNALLAATSATSATASSCSRDVSVAGRNHTGARSGYVLRQASPVRSPSPARTVGTGGTSTSQSRSRSRSRGRNLTAANTAAVAATATSSSTSASTSVAAHPPKPNTRSASFLAATLAASRTASPGITPSHTGQLYGQQHGQPHGSGGSSGGPPPAHLSAALLASAAGDERRRATAAAVASASRSTDSLGRYAGSLSTSSLSSSHLGPSAEPDTTAIPPTSSLISMFEVEKGNTARAGKPIKKAKITKAKSIHENSGNDGDDMSPVRRPPPNLKAFTPPRSVSPTGKGRALLTEDELTPKASEKTSARPAAKPPTKPKPASTKTATKPPTSPLTKSPVKPTPLDPPAKKQVTPKQPMAQPQPKREAKSEPHPAQSEPMPIPIPIPKGEVAISRDSALPADKVNERLQSTSMDTASLRRHRLPLRELNNDDDVMEKPRPPLPRVRKPSATSTHSAARSSQQPKDAARPIGPSRVASAVSHGPAPLAPVPRRSMSGLLPRPNASGLNGVGISPPRRTASTVDGLANAIMAGSLAAASQSHTSHTSPSLSLSRPSSPSKRTSMLQTLRRERAKSDDEYDDDRDGNTHYRRSHYHRDGRLRQGKHYYSHATPAVLVGGGRHKHKHHEGSRKRWREAITERQRRRYEAVWASNRGMRGLVAGSSIGDADGFDDETVPNVVVRDLWQRSRLPVDELGEVWDLVDDTGTGRLSKVGFVVGLWLIDQRPRGRKIPARVSESVWASARGMQVSAKQRKR